MGRLGSPSIAVGPLTYPEAKNASTNGTRLERLCLTIRMLKWGLSTSGEVRKSLLIIVLQIPVGTDILVTHTPPVGYGDRCATGVRAGCVELLNTVQKRVKPKYHIYGHIHEGK